MCVRVHLRVLPREPTRARCGDASLVLRHSSPLLFSWFVHALVALCLAGARPDRCAACSSFSGAAPTRGGASGAAAAQGRRPSYSSCSLCHCARARAFRQLWPGCAPSCRCDCRCKHNRCSDGRCKHNRCCDGRCKHNRCCDGRCKHNRCCDGRCQHDCGCRWRCCCSARRTAPCRGCWCERWAWAWAWEWTHSRRWWAAPPRRRARTARQPLGGSSSFACNSCRHCPCPCPCPCPCLRHCCCGRHGRCSSSGCRSRRAGRGGGSGRG
jgi:hypothetical protein